MQRTSRRDKRFGIGRDSAYADRPGGLCVMGIAAPCFPSFHHDPPLLSSYHWPRHSSCHILLTTIISLSAARRPNHCYPQPSLPALPKSSALRRVLLLCAGHLCTGPYFCWLCLALAWYMPSSSIMFLRAGTARYSCPTRTLCDRYRSQ